MPLSPGEKLGPYEITAPIGKGGMGEVYRAHDSRLKRDVAIKVSAAQFSERFEREAQAIAALNHPHICQLYDVGPNYLVMEYIAGAPLHGPLPVDQALKYAIQICDALDAAHKKGITHRDLKPSNILLTRQGIKLLDFGLAKFGSSGITPEPAGATLTMALTGKNEIVGTLYYMSPEQLQAQANGEEIDGRSDIFSFGLVLYEILTGKRAFEGSSPASVIAAIMERPAPSIADKTMHAVIEFKTRTTEFELDQYLEPEPDGEESQNGFEGMVGSSTALRGILDHIRTVAPTDSTVLIEGETGTGKELIAHAIHTLSKRADRPFVKLNCAAIPLGLLESELFGHEKGAFTGAVAQKKGRFEAADGGTLFLDEIGDIPLELQAKLLRVLQEQEFERLGSTFTHRVNVRVVAATNQDLAGLVAEKKFRMDLYYRINVFPITVPPLRHRLEDIPTLVAHFVHRYAKSMVKEINKISSDAMEALVRYPWPGNIRELRNFIERAVILTNGEVLHSPALPTSPLLPTGPVTLAEAERDHILNALKESNWVVGGAAGAAARLGVKRTTLISMMRRRGVSRAMASGAV